MRKRWLSYTLLFVLLFQFASFQDEASAKPVIVSLKYAGGSYQGEVKNGRPEGYGTMAWTKDKVYQGNWKNGQRSGYGKYISKVVTTEKTVSSEYSGYWKNDKQEGIGKWTKAEASEAGWEKSLEQGTYKNGLLIKGYIVKNVLGDPDTSVEYKSSELSFYIWGEGSSIKHSIMQHMFFSFYYSKGSVQKMFSFEDGMDESYSPKKYDTFVKGIQKELEPHLKQLTFLKEQLSKVKLPDLEK